jgi:hypothetical protein
MAPTVPPWRACAACDHRGMWIEVVVGATLVTGLITFMVGAVAWRLAYEEPRPESLRLIHADRARRRWIHVWMIAGLLVTPAGIVGRSWVPALHGAGPLPAMAAAVYALGAVCWIVSLAFRLTVVPWAAQRTVDRGAMPEGFTAFEAWAGALYVIHMLAAYVSFAVIGGAIVTTSLPTWLGWLGLGWGVTFLAGFVLTRFSGPFNPPLWAHTYTAVVGVVLLVSG